MKSKPVSEGKQEKHFKITSAESFTLHANLR